MSTPPFPGPSAAHGGIPAAGAGRAELVGQFALSLPMMVLTDLCGLLEEGARLVTASRQLVGGTRKALEADRHIHGILGRLVAAKHRAPGPDLASWLIEHEAALSDDEVRQHLRLVLVLAHEATTNLMVNTLRMVLTDPRFRGTLHGGQMTLPAAVEQILWDEPPLTVLPARFPRYDMEIAGREIREGDLLLLGLAAGNADPATGRTTGQEMYGNRSHLSFNSGPHECPGQDIGRAVTGSGIDTLIARLPDLRLAVPGEELTWTSSSWSRRLDALPVRFTPRHDRDPFARPPAGGRRPGDGRGRRNPGRRGRCGAHGTGPRAGRPVAAPAGTRSAGMTAGTAAGGRGTSGRARRARPPRCAPRPPSRRRR
ncbi:cytochrome P450 [Streptomyces verrucosisporus]|uniref:cytochrome P450 n=1 Tax=Streptomyces verrucosisporus TaxID=1695161 RepID=UPI0019D30687|nr:cytochrome P450 [Streptomyces verrucosisporus]MBN3928247.1 cytochrome P450 [Streptomyces verrucosisporus]